MKLKEEKKRSATGERILKTVVEEVSKIAPVMHGTSFCAEGDCENCLTRRGCSLVSLKLGILFCLDMMEQKEYEKARAHLVKLYGIAGQA